QRRRGPRAAPRLRHAVPRGLIQTTLTTNHPDDMATEAKNVKFRKQLAKLEAWKRAPDKVKLLPRQRIRIRLRCKICGRPRSVYPKFGICRICFRSMASDGLIPGVKKASW